MSDEMALIAKSIPAIAYNAETPVGAFRYKNWRVIMHKRDIHIKDIEKEADAIEVINYLKELVEKSHEKQGR